MKGLQAHDEARGLFKDSRGLAAACLILVAVTFGGGTRSGLASDLVVGLVAWPMLLATIPLSLRPVGPAATRVALAFVLALLLVPILQLVPLPPTLWRALPGREMLSQPLTVAGAPLGWRPATVSISATLEGLASLAAPLAVFLLVIQLSRSRRRMILAGLIAFGMLSVIVGFLQISQGSGSPLRFYAITNPTEAVGFFANRNHFACLLYMLLPIAAAWIIGASTELKPLDKKEVEARSVVLLSVLIGVFGALLLAIGMTRSRAGIGVAVVAVLASFALAWPLRQEKGSLRTARYLLAAVGIGCLLVAQFAVYRLVQRVDIDIVDQYRVEMSERTLATAKAFLPVGSGIGTFVPVYFAFERAETADVEYVNRAHNDFAETLLEAGIVAPIMVISFLVWWGFRARRLWSRDGGGRDLIDRLLARAATIAVVLPILHSGFDYPLRTIAVMTVFAVLAACMVDPSDDMSGVGNGRPPGRHRRRSRSPKAAGAAVEIEPRPVPA